MLRPRPALITRPAQPRIELVLHRTLDDQPRPEPRQLRQRLARALTHPHSQQILDLHFNLRRRRYGTSHGVGLLHRLPGPEGTYAVALTTPTLFTAPLRRDRTGRRTAARASKRQRRSAWPRSAPRCR